MRKVIAIAGIAGLSLVWAAIPAAAGKNASFDSTPASGPPGTVIHASDHNFECDEPGFDVHVELVSQDEETVAEADTVVTNDSIWDVDLTVPADAAPGDYAVTATCTGDGGESRLFYNDNEFVVTEAAATTTTTTTTTIAATAATTTTTVPPVEVVPAATPAAPVVASPALTG